MICSPKTRQNPSTVVLEHELVTTENILRNALTTVTKLNGSSDDVYIRNCIMSLKTKTKNYEVANHALVTRKQRTSYVHAAGQLVEIRLGIVHRDSCEALKLLNSRLIAIGYERCSSLHGSSIQEESYKVPGTVNNLTHAEHKLVALINATPTACASDDHIVIEEPKAQFELTLAEFVK